MKAIVMGRNYTSILGMLRCAGEAGCEITVIRTVRKMPKEKKTKWSLPQVEAKSRYVEKYLYATEPDSEGLVQLLMDQCRAKDGKVILLPTDDFTASVTDLNRDLLKEYFLFPHVEERQGGIVQLMDKEQQKRWASAAGMNVVDSWKIEYTDEGYAIPDGLPFPLFVKPEFSYLGRKGQIARCETMEDLKQLCGRIAQNECCPLLAERFIRIEKEYGVVGFSDAKQVVTPILIEKTAIGSGHHLGVTLLGKVVSMDSNPVLRDQIHQMIRGTHFTGLFDIDLFESEGKMYFNELNLRMGAFGYAARCAGVNLPGMLIANLTGREEKEADLARENFLCISEKVNYEEFRSGNIGFKEMKNNLKKADAFFIRSETDPGPWRAFRMIEARGMVRRLLKKH